MPTYEVTINGRKARVTAATPEEAAEAVEAVTAGAPAGKREPKAAAGGRSLNPVTAWKETVADAWDDFAGGIRKDYQETQEDVRKMRTETAGQSVRRRAKEDPLGLRQLGQTGMHAVRAVNLALSPITGVGEALAVRPYGAAMGAITDRPAAEWEDDMRMALSAGRSPRGGGYKGKATGPAEPRAARKSPPPKGGAPAPAARSNPAPAPPAAPSMPPDLATESGRIAARILAKRAPELAQLPVNEGRAVTTENRLPFEEGGRGARALARAVAAVDGPGADMAQTTLGARRAGAEERLLARLRSELGDDGSSYHDVLKAADRARKKAADPLYEAAHANDIQLTDELRDLLRRPDVEKARRLAYDLARKEGQDPERLGLNYSERLDDWTSDDPWLLADADMARAQRIAARKAPQKVIRGPSLLEWISRGGGIRDDGGELAAMGLDKWHVGRPFRRRLQADGPGGDTLDGWAQRAVEAGYLPESVDGYTPKQLLEAMAEESRGRMKFAREADLAQVERNELYDQAQELMYRGSQDPALLPSPDDYGARPAPRPDLEYENIPTMRAWDYIKRKLDDELTPFRMGKLEWDNDARATAMNLERLRQILVDQNPVYGKALRAYAGPSKQMEALKAARAAVRRQIDPEDLDELTGDMSQDTFDAYQVGVARGLSDEFRANSPSTVVNRILRDKVLQDRLRSGFRNSDSYDQFMADVRREAEMQASFNELLTGSRTTPLRETIDGVNADGADGVADAVFDAAEQLARGEGFFSMARRGAAKKVANMRNPPALRDPEVSRILGEVLFEGRPAQEVLQAAVRRGELDPDEARGIMSVLQSGDPRALILLLEGGEAAELVTDAE